MATTRSLVSSSPIAFVRDRYIQCTVKDCRPNTKLYAFFDSANVTDKCIQKTGASFPTVTDFESTAPRTNALFSDENGTCEFTLHVEGGKYASGAKEVMVSDTTDAVGTTLVGNVYGSASTTFTSRGVIETYQTTITNTTIIENWTPTTVVDVFLTQGVDPLAESFFTYGVTSGIYVTAVELFFQGKDSTIPVTVELREMINGYPSPNKPSATAQVSLTPENVQISNDSSKGTIFRFPSPIYLAENKEYCFVVLANTNNYSVWTSKMGERSVESDKIIHEQPYVGSIFHSSNNSTWTAEQFEDIKFRIYRANFNTGTNATVNFSGVPNTKLYQGNRFTTKSGTNLILFQSYMRHGLSVGSELSIACPTVGTVYNGIPGAKINGNRAVTRVIDEYIVEFAAAALSGETVTSGKIYTSGTVNQIILSNAGSGYTAAPTVTISAPTSGTTATATAEVYNGKVSRIVITDAGSGYTSTPNVVITPVSGGTGASAEASIEAIFTVASNKPVNAISSRIKHSVVQDTKINATYTVGTDVYGTIPEKELSMTAVEYLDASNAVIASRQNEFAKRSNAPSFEINMSLESTNSNVSPVINISSGIPVSTYAGAINNQSVHEDTSSVLASSGLTGYTITSGGSGYTNGTQSIVTIVPAETDKATNIVAATATATVSGGIVTAINITSAGSGYTVVPTIVIAPPSAGTTATAQGTIAPINSELNAVGNAYTRYLTKKISLLNPSTAIKLLSYIYSTEQTNVDWYIRTSLSGDSSVHEDNQYRLLKCSTPRNKSSGRNSYFDYEFVLTDIPAFDVYDLKCVCSSSNPSIVPIIKNYRVVVAA